MQARTIILCGARVRIIQKFVREPLADYLLEKNPAAGAKIKVEVEGLKMAEG